MKSDAPQSTDSKVLFGESDDSDWEDLGGGKFVADLELVLRVTSFKLFTCPFLRGDRDK